ncbi:MAG: perosamine synthetase [Glaciecola sp.]|jgi:perosamine synthetase
MNDKFIESVSFIKSKFPNQNFIPLHEPRFQGNEKKYLNDAIDSTFVSSIGAYVNKFEDMMCDITGAKYAIATANGTSALHLALLVAGVKREDEVLTQSLTFIATANAISYIGASSVFLDVDKDTMGMSPVALQNYLSEFADKKEGQAFSKVSGKRIRACVPMHTFGFPCRTKKLAIICKEWGIILVEDTAESIGSYHNGVHTGLDGLVSAFSFNGNKTVTCGGGGALITNDEKVAKLAKHLSTQAKIPHPYEFRHDHIGYNYRMPNLNAALACAQLEQLPQYLVSKRKLAAEYATFFKEVGVNFVTEPEGSQASYWLNCLLFDNKDERNEFLDYANKNGVMSRPAWELMHTLDMFKDAHKGDMTNSEWITDRLVNIPSSVIQ